MFTPLADAGHEPIALARSAASARSLAGSAAVDVVIADVFDRQELLASVGRVRPDVVVHQLTSLPSSLAATVDLAAAFALNARIRTEGTANLVAAANATGASRVIAQSLAFAYAPVGPMIVSEEAPLFLDAPDPWRRTVAAVAELERQVLEVAHGAGVVLRYGALYGNGTWWDADGDYTADVRGGAMPVIGSGAGVTSFVHVDDAARAAVCAVDADTVGIVNITDDDPTAAADWLPHVAARLGAPEPRRLDERTARERLGWQAVHRHTDQRGASNRRMHDNLRYSLLHPTWRDGLGGTE
jgi:nucleoside-diphosphate-sugar epimerase